MKSWLIYDREGADRNRDYIDLHETLGKKYGIDFELVYAEELLKTVLSDTKPEDHIPQIFYQIRLREDLSSPPDFAVVRTICPALTRALETAGIPTWNNSFVSAMTNHKGHCMDLIRSRTSVPTIPTQTFTMPLTDPVDTEILQSHTGIVLKSASGHGGADVVRIPASVSSEVSRWLSSDPTGQRNNEPPTSPDGLAHLLETAKNQRDDLILQPFIEGSGSDVRVYVVGDRIVAAVKRTAPEGEFRSNFSLGGTISTYDLNETETGYVRQIIRLFDFGMVGIDFILDEQGGFIFNEIEDVVGARMLYQTYPEIDILEEYLCFLAKKNGPTDPVIP